MRLRDWNSEIEASERSQNLIRAIASVAAVPDHHSDSAREFAKETIETKTASVITSTTTSGL
jgi:hypothetical protein